LFAAATAEQLQSRVNVTNSFLLCYEMDTDIDCIPAHLFEA